MRISKTLPNGVCWVCVSVCVRACVYTYSYNHIDRFI